MRTRGTSSRFPIEGNVDTIDPLALSEISIAADGGVRTPGVRRPGRAAAIYAAMVLGAVASFFLIGAIGEGLSAPPAVATADAATSPAARSAPSVLSHLLIALTAILVVGRVLRRVFARIGQPAVIGEVVGGILLGPSLLGAISPSAYHFVLAPSVIPYLDVVAQLGVLLYMFLVGLDLNPEHVRDEVHATVAISHASIVVPFVLGSSLALFLYPRFSTADVPFTSFALFAGVAMSITAFPVLARILTDLQISRTPLGVIALTCAAVDDVTAWCLLALVAGIVRASANGAVVVVVLALAFIGLMFGVVRPLIARWLRNAKDAEPSRSQIVVVIIGVLIAALVTEGVGLHAVFGAFLFGAVIPHDSRLAQVIAGGLEELVTILLVPAFFAITGMRTQIGLLSSPAAWLACGLITLVATAGKFGGTLVAARFGGFTWRAAAALGTLMNTRGLMQLIVLNVGLDLGVITPSLFTMMVLMAIATTMATTPALRWLVARPWSGA